MATAAILLTEIHPKLSLELRLWIRTRRTETLSVVDAIEALKESAKIRDELKRLYDEFGMFYLYLT